MKWYLVKMIYELSISCQPVHTIEHWRLIRADEAQWAHEKATILGRINGFDPAPSSGRFLEVTEVCELPDVYDGLNITAIQNKNLLVS